MNTRDLVRYEMFGRVEVFGKANAADFTPDSEGGKRFASITQIIHDVGLAAAGQQAGRALLKATLLETLQEDVRNIARTARAIAQDEPHFAESFLVPKNVRQAEFILAVHAMLRELNKPDIAAKFIAQHLPDDFVQQVTSHYQAVVDAQDTMDGDDQDGAGSTVAVGRLMRRGIKDVKYLDAIVRNEYAQVPEKLRAWEVASTAERLTRRKKSAASTPTAGTEPAASSPTAGPTPAAPAAAEAGRVAG